MFRRQILCTIKWFSVYNVPIHHPVPSRLISSLSCRGSLRSKPTSMHFRKNIYISPVQSVKRLYCKYSTDKSSVNQNKVNSKESMESTIPKSLESDYVAFEDQQHIIQDVIEEVWNPLPQEDEEASTLPDYLLRRGKTGVFDIGELVEILHEENGRDVCVIKIPKELDYADYMTIVTARNPKHMHALSTFIRKRFKMKDRKSTDLIPRIEGTNRSTDWLAIDLGNIVLHVFTWQTREKMDLETLWTVGPQFDDLYNQPDSEVVALLKSIT